MSSDKEGLVLICSLICVVILILPTSSLFKILCYNNKVHFFSIRTAGYHVMLQAVLTLTLKIVCSISKDPS